METLQIDILDPKAKKMLEDMVAKELIGVRLEKQKKDEFFNLLDSLRSNSENISLEDITKEVEIVRTERYAPKGD